MKNFEEAKHEMNDTNKNIYPLIEEKLKSSSQTYKDIFDLLDIKTNEDILKTTKNFKELKEDSSLYTSLIFLKHQLVILTYLFNAINSEVLSNVYQSSSDKLNLLLGREEIGPRNITISLLESYKILCLKNDLIKQLLKRK